MSLKFLLKAWKDALRKAKLDDRKFHSLRHTYASGLIRNMVNMKVVSELCGHSSIMVTLDTYSHLLPTDTDDIADIADMLAGEMLGKNPKW